MDSWHTVLSGNDRAGQAQAAWFISIWGESSLDTRPIIKREIELGGHIETDLELFFDPDRSPTNLELLQEVQGIACEVGRPLATHQMARELYGIKVSIR